MKFDSIIFDLDGTLWDSAQGVSESWTEILSKYDYDRKSVTKEEVYGIMGLQLDKIADKLFPTLDIEVRKDLMKECCEYENDYVGERGGVLFDKLEETLEKLASKYKLFIVSNCQDGYIECFYKAHKLDTHFIDYECPGRTGLSKGENIKLVIERNNLKNPIYVGDTQGDADSAKFAEIPFVYARYGFGKVKEYDYVIDKFEEILNI